jgi:tetratricopeptide (TPR) repeat protein
MPRRGTLATVSSLVVSAALAMNAERAAAQATRTPAAASMRELAREVAVEFAGRAGASEREGRPHAAEALYYRALEADPGYIPAHLSYARLLHARGRTDEALQVLDSVPARALELDSEVVQLARARATYGDLDGALSVLTSRSESTEAARVRAELASNGGRFPEALLAARRLADLARGSTEERSAQLLVRALGILVGDADAVRVPGAGASLIRRLLAD